MKDFIWILVSTTCLILCSSCGDTHSDHQETNDSSTIKMTVEKRHGELFANITNNSQDGYITTLTKDGELDYNGIYAYDSLFCATGEIRLSSITDVFNLKLDTILSGEVKEYKLSLFTPFIAEVLDSTSIYTFKFWRSGFPNSIVNKFIVSARGTDGKHKFAHIATKTKRPNEGQYPPVATDLSVCRVLVPVESPN
ncbi:hypothetical protein QWY85_11205 [Neolewinella lacunae]|uniref:Uncharacterized protein n=1 Tax=Neolewinella lacunae TaxID=1517758 RepID=A0A923PR43_9BACT|nr:hypothetical protein [Neolewinella lacunae]MBC6995928.1 hypothetical protein [Neolewinella lacunae]MDN3635228.1 hypothetical protein [Neolewinella lacunae]